MRIIKLSSDDQEMGDRSAVDLYFQETLQSRNPIGKFLLTNRRISKKGIKPKELLLFSYLGEVVYLAEAGSMRMNNTGEDAHQYPFYFCVDTATIQKGAGRLDEFERLVGAAGLNKGNIVRSRGWPILADSPALRTIWEQFVAK